ncbi:uncharacterized protein V3H82_004779 [Fundulus diaphanus]
MSVNAAQLDLNQLIYRHLKEHGFVSAAEELLRHSPQGETGPSVSLLDIYNSWLKHPKKKGRNSAKCSKSGKGKSSAKAKSATPKKKTEKTIKNLSLPQSSPKKSVPVKRKKADEKAGQSVPKAKKSKLNTTETAAAAVGDGSDSDSSLDVEKWKKLLYQFTEADVAKLETINALASPEPNKRRVRKPRAKPLSKADTPVQQNGETVRQKEKGKEKAVTQTPTTKNTAKKSPNKRTKSVEDTSIPPPEKPTQLQEMSVPVNAEDHKTDETEVAPEPKKKKKKKEKEDKTEGKTNCDGTGNDRKQKRRSEITEQEDAKTENEVGKIEESNGTNENISELGLQKKKAKKKEKEKTRSEEYLAQAGEKTKKNAAGDEGNSEQLVGEINLPANVVGSDKNSEQNAQDKKAKKKKGKNNTEGNLEDVTAAEEANIQQNIIEKQHSEQIGQKKKKKKKEKTGSKENSTQIHEKKEEKKGMVNTEGNAEQTDDDVKANTEQIINTNELGDNEKSEQNVEGEKAKKKKEKKNVEGNLPIEQNVDDKENSEQMSEKKKKKKKKKKESVGSEEAPEEVAREKKLKHKNEKSDKNDLERTVEEENLNDEGGCTENKSTLETSECGLETTTPAKKKKKKKNKLKTDEFPEEADISPQDVSATQTNSVDVHKKKKKSKSAES